jgi:hypothetical protein
MFAMQYAHRLPADYDLQIIRQRAAERGPLWDATPGLLFKAFVLQQAGQLGATGNVYASVYLWDESAAAADFIASERFDSVIRSFGRPAIETWLPAQALRGLARQGRTLYREEQPLPVDPAMLAGELERNQAIAAQHDTVAVWTVLDMQRWQWLRFTLSANEPDGRHAQHVYEVLHLAAPGLAQLS